MDDYTPDEMGLVVRSESRVTVPECATCGSSKPCIMCMGSKVHPWNTGARSAFVNCPACWGTGIDHE